MHGEYLLYDECMTRVFSADPLSEERSALRLVLQDLHLEVIGEATDWKTTLAQALSDLGLKDHYPVIVLIGGEIDKNMGL